MKGAGSETVLVASVSLIQVRERREIIMTIIRMTSAVLYTIYLSSTLCLSHLSHHFFIPLRPSFRSLMPLRPAVRSSSRGRRDSFAELLPVLTWEIIVSPLRPEQENAVSLSPTPA